MCCAQQVRLAGQAPCAPCTHRQPAPSKGRSKGFLLHQANRLQHRTARRFAPLPAAGEVHLETCIKDLKERFARCELVVSPPLVAFRRALGAGWAGLGRSFCPRRATALLHTAVPEWGGDVGPPLSAGPHPPPLHPSNPAPPPRRETVFCREEAPPETTARPVFAVEASTASGACTLRVMALPLPASVATVLDQNADLLRLALGGAAKAAAGGDEQPGRQAAVQQQGAAAEADVGGGTGAPGSDSLAALGKRLRAVAGAAEQEGLLPLLQRVWMFGPKRVGPNLLLAAPSSGGGAAAASLFALPPERVVRLAKQQPGRAALLPTAGRPESAASDAADGAAEGEEAHEQRHLAVPLGFPEGSLKLGLAASDETAASHAAAAVADLSCQLGAMDVCADGAAAAAAANGSAAGAAEGAADAAAAADSSLGRSLEYLRYSVESGVASGFQMAAAAGPLCDEPLWGVAFAVEARLNLPPPGAVGELGCAERFCLSHCCPSDRRFSCAGWQPVPCPLPQSPPRTSRTRPQAARAAARQTRRQRCT